MNQTYKLGLRGFLLSRNFDNRLNQKLRKQLTSHHEKRIQNILTHKQPQRSGYLVRLRENYDETCFQYR